MKCIICEKEIEDEKEEIVLPCSVQSNDGSDYVSAHKTCCLNGLWYNPDTGIIFKDVNKEE